MLRLLPRLRPTSSILPRAQHLTPTTTTRFYTPSSNNGNSSEKKPAPAPAAPSPPSPTTNNAINTATPAEDDTRLRTMQSPNRAQPWASSQRPRSAAMTGPRFEQTDITTQPAPYAAIELIHAEPVRFVESRVAVCDGGGGPHGHPRVYINVDKPEIVPCGYCGLPFAHSHHKHYLETLPSTEYPLA